ncbi:MAG: amidohydrolase [Deltaproteobacteria bacterium]|nr:MAG: amidohydrolase [Deltaproteobacteria bacterium]
MPELGRQENENTHQQGKERSNGMIIDFRMVVPIREYVDPEEAKRKLPASYMKGYVGTYEEAALLVDVSVEDLIRSMEKGGVDKAVMQAEWAFGDYRKQNDAAYRIVKKYPDRFVAAYMCVNPLEDDDMAGIVEREVGDRGFKGVNIQPFAYRVRCNDKRFYPLYEKCQELDIPVTIHTSINFSTNRSIDFGRPLYLDEIACDFPDLTIVANHGGWPWVTEMVAVAWKHPNVYIEIGAVSPKYIGMPGTGWDPIMVYGNSLLQDRILFATDNMLPAKRCIEEINTLPLKGLVKEKWLGLNASRLLNLD